MTQKLKPTDAMIEAARAQLARTAGKRLTNARIARIYTAMESARDELREGSYFQAMNAAVARIAELEKELAAIPCQTKAPEDAESGCCAPCRARTALSRNVGDVG